MTSDDLVKRLRAWHAPGETITGDVQLYLDAADEIERLRNQLAAVQTGKLRLEWRDGAPPKPWSEEWFIAETTFRDRVVLRSLPEEWTYDFKTADDTYIKTDKIKRWMQFPDSEYIAPAAPIEMLAALPDDKRASEDGWRPIETAPVEPYETVSDYYRFRCLLQDSKGDVFEGYGYYVKLGRATTHKTLRWASKHGQCFPKYWRPMPAPFQPTPSREPRPAGGAPASSEEE